MLPTRLRTAAGWSDACILNVSSRGLLLHSSCAAREGSCIEVRHGAHAIVARVVWRNGAKVGLQSEDRVPVDDILTLGQSSSLQLTAVQRGTIERRRQARVEDQSRRRARSVEFASIAFIALWLGGGLLVLVQEALARPLAYVESALER